MRPITLFALALLASSVFPQKKTTVAVIEFNATSGLSKTESTTLTNRFRDMLVQTSAFQVIERDKMEAILKEQDFILSDNCNSAECAVQVGQLLGVEQMIAGDIGKIGQTWTVGLRLIDISTGKITKTQTGDYKGDVDGLLEIMRQIAYIFAGLKPPKGSTTVFIRNETKLPGRIQFDARFTVAGSATSGGKDYTNSIGTEFSIGYMLTKKIKLALEVKSYGISYKDTLNADGIPESPLQFDARPRFNGAGLTGFYYFRTSGWKPFVAIGAGFQSFNSQIHMTQYSDSKAKERKNLEDQSSFFLFTGIGLNIPLSHWAEINTRVGNLWTKPVHLVAFQGGLSFNFGKSFDE